MASTPLSHLGPGVRLARNVVWNFGGQGWSLVLALGFTPYIVHRLGTDAYGLLITVGIVTDYFWFMNLGLGQATVKYLAEHAAAEDWEQVRRIFWASAIVYVVLGSLAALGIVAAGSFLVDRWLTISPELHAVASSLF